MSNEEKGTELLGLDEPTAIFDKKNENVSSHGEGVIELNVGGSIFTCSQATLLENTSDTNYFHG